MASARAAEDKPINLLRLASATVATTSAEGEEAARLAALTDGNPGSFADVAATQEAPLEIVYGFAGAEMAPEGVRVTIPPAGGEVPPAARVEVLVSSLSAHAGFRSLRADPLKPGAKPALLEFLPTAARFVLVRLSPAAGAQRLSVAEVELLGRPGPPESLYAFAESPARAFDVLKRLESTSSLAISITEDEKALFARARQGRLDASAFTEAALLASGVLDAGARARHVKRLGELEQQARGVVARASGPSARGEALLRWLHQGPMAKGYVAAQTDLSTLLDTGTYNCVSSATLFNCLALRLGLDARAIEVPTHAFAVVYDGTKAMDVETTTADGFNPARDPAVIARFEKTTGFRYIHDLHRDQRREVDEAGLAAIIYYNHGVMLAAKQRYHEALLANFRAMSLDAEFASAVKNALAVLARWGFELSREGKHEQALEVIGTGLALAPRDATLRTNRLAVWQTFAEQSIDAGRADEALAILERAALAVPDGGFVERRAWVFLKGAEKRVSEGRWEEALAATGPGLERLEGPSRREVERWRSNLHLRWFSAEMRTKRFAEAADALTRGMRTDDPHPGLRQNLGYLAQEWARSLAGEQGPAAALTQLRALVARFPGSKPVAEAAARHVRSHAARQADAGAWQEALAGLEQGKDLVPEAKDLQAAVVRVFDTWAKARMKAKAWAEAADVYAEARRRYPTERLIAQNIAYLAQEWTKAAFAQGGAPEAGRVTRLLAATFPGIDGLAHGGANQLRRAVQDLLRAGKHEEALRAADDGAELLDGDAKAVDLYASIYDAWARRHSSVGAWQAAIDVYAAGLLRFPASTLLKQNARAGWHAWAKSFSDAKRWDEAIAVYDKALERFPGDRALAQNRAWCGEQKKKG